MALPTEYRALREAAGIVDRSARGRLTLTGADRRTYLQGLLSNDIEALAPGAGCYAAYLTAQGRMIADMRVFETGRSLLVDLDGSRAAPVAARWTQFVFSEDVQISNDSDSTAEIGVYGPLSAQVVSNALAALATMQPGDVEEILHTLPLYGNRSWEVSGASLVVLRESDAARVGIRPRPSDYTATAITANGKIKAARATIDRIELGGITVFDVAAMVLPDEALAKNLLAVSFLSPLKRYEYANGRIVLEQ